MRIIRLPVTATTLERCKDLHITMRQVEDRLWKSGSLDNASDLDRTLFFNQHSHFSQQRRRELERSQSVTFK